MRAAEWKFHEHLTQALKLLELGGVDALVRRGLVGELKQLIWEETGGQIWSKWDICKTLRQLIQQSIQPFIVEIIKSH